MADRDGDDCRALKDKLESFAAEAGLCTPRAGDLSVDVLNRIVVEELEAWFFGDVPASRAAYERVSASLGKQVKYRDPDAIAGGTWEALERILVGCGYHEAGLSKLLAADEIVAHMDVESNCSKSFQVFRDGLRRLVSEGSNAEAN